MGQKSEGEYLPIEIARRFMEDHPGIGPDMTQDEIVDYFSKPSISKRNRRKLISIATILLGWLKNKQAFCFQRNFLQELIRSEQLDREVESRLLPSEPLYFDLSEYDSKLDGKEILGVFIRREEDTLFLLAVLAADGKRDKNNLQARLVQYVINLPGPRTLRELLEFANQEVPSCQELLRVAILCMAYISGEDSDVQDAGRSFSISWKRNKKVFTTVRKWNVGYQVAKTHQNDAEKKKTQMTGEVGEAEERTATGRGRSRARKRRFRIVKKGKRL